MENEKYRVLGFDHEFVKVASLKNPLLTGYLELSRVILKIDFASFVLPQKGDWIPFLYRENKSAVLENQRRRDLAEIAGVITRPDLVVVNQMMPEERLAPRSTAEIKKTEATLWIESNLKGHGSVFWKKPIIKSGSNPEPSPVSTEEILSKDLFSVAFHPKNPKQALVSGNGIFLTQDGRTWRKLKIFQNENLPVAIGEKGELFVGASRSIDGGQSFSPFLRWQDLTTLMEKRHQKSPATLRMTEIKILGSDKIQIGLDTGVWKLALLGSNKFGLVTEWKVLHEN